MGARPWMKFWVGDYLKDTAMLTAEEHGAYFLLLLQLWNDGGAVAQRDAQRVARVSEERWPDVWSRIGRFFDVQGDYLTQKRVTIELTAWDQEQNARRRGAAITNEKRWGASLSDSDSDSQAMSSTSRKSEVRSQKPDLDPNVSESQAGSQGAADSGPGIVIGPHGYEAPSWHPDRSWRHLTGIWSNAGRWPDGENFPAARKEFLKRVNAENWPEVCAGVDWAVTESIAQRNRLHLGTLTMFLREDRWKAQVPPMKSASEVAAVTTAEQMAVAEANAPLPWT